MGWLRSLFGSKRPVAAEPVADGLPGRAEVVNAQVAGPSRADERGISTRLLTLELRIRIDGEPEFTATATQWMPESALPRLAAGTAVVAVLVDPLDHAHILVDLAAPIPEVTLPPASGSDSAAWVLEHGEEVRVVVVHSQKAVLKNAAGLDIYALTLTVYEGVDTPYQVQVGNPVPADGLALLYPGARLSARRGLEADAIVVDFAAGAIA